MCKYEVKCKCGHVGKNNYIIIAFAVIANDGKEAAYKARFFPRVKHDHKDAIVSVRKISDYEYYKLLDINNKDEYLHCTNKQQQNCLDLSERIYSETKECREYLDQKESKQCYYGKIIVKNPKKFFRNIFYESYLEEAYVC